MTTVADVQKVVDDLGASWQQFKAAALIVKAERDQARREREEALQEVGRLRAQVEAFTAATADVPHMIAVAVQMLDGIRGKDDPERAHGEADDVLLSCVPPEVREAYQRLAKRAEWWATA